MSKKLESKNQILNKLLETIEIICNKAAQLNILPIPQLLFEYESNDRNKFEREGIKVPKTNNIRNNQKDSQQEMNNLNSGKTDLIEKQLNDSEI